MLSGVDRAGGGWGGGLARALHGRGGALLGAAAHAGGHVHLSSSLSWLFFPNPADNTRYSASGKSQLSVISVCPEQVQVSPEPGIKVGTGALPSAPRALPSSTPKAV